jgi:hypothetical protein
MATPSEKDRHRHRRNAAQKQRSVRVAASRTSHCRCDWCVIPYARHQKHRNALIAKPVDHEHMRKRDHYVRMTVDQLEMLDYDELQDALMWREDYRMFPHDEEEAA